jgi:hypothetical protein
VTNKLSPINKSCILELERNLGYKIDCGYSEILLKYGTGEISSHVYLMHPDHILSDKNKGNITIYSNKELYNFKFPKELNNLLIEDCVALGTTGTRLIYVYHPDARGKILIADGDSENIYISDHGFLDPRCYYNDTHAEIIASDQLIYDTFIDKKTIQYVNHDNPLGFGAITMSWINLGFQKGDIIDGRLAMKNYVRFYSRNIDGYVSYYGDEKMMNVHEVYIRCDIEKEELIEEFTKFLEMVGYKRHLTSR